MDKLQELFKQSGMTVTELSVQLGISRTAVSAALRGKYTGSKDISYKIEKYLENKVSAGKGSDALAYLTNGQKTVLAVLHYTLEDSEFSIISGPAGVGKTYVCQYFATNRNDILYFKMIDGQSHGDIIDMMMAHFGIHQKGSIIRRFNKLVEALKVNKIRMVMADEVDLFTKGSKAAFLKKLSVFREIYELGISVILIGLPDLEKQLRETDEKYIISRIGYSRKIKDVGTSELMDFWTHLGGSVGDDATLAIRKATQCAWLRTLKKIYSRSQLVGVRQATSLIFE